MFYLRRIYIQMQTPKERKRRERQKLKDQGLIQKSFWLKPSVLEKIEAYRKHNNCTYNEALEGLLL